MDFPFKTFKLQHSRNYHWAQKYWPRLSERRQDSR